MGEHGSGRIGGLRTAALDDLEEPSTQTEATGGRSVNSTERWSSVPGIWSFASGHSSDGAGELWCRIGRCYAN